MNAHQKIIFKKPVDGNRFNSHTRVQIKITFDLGTYSKLCQLFQKLSRLEGDYNTKAEFCGRDSVELQNN